MHLFLIEHSSTSLISFKTNIMMIEHQGEEQKFKVRF